MNDKDTLHKNGIPHLGKVSATLKAFLDKIEVRQEFFSIRSLDPYPADFH